MESYAPTVDSRAPELQEHFQYVIEQTQTLHRMAVDFGRKLDEHFNNNRG